MSDATSSQAKPPAQAVPPASPHAASALALQVGVVIIADDALKSERVRAVIGAGYYSTSLREAVDSCVEAAHKAAEAGGLETAPPRAA